MVKPKKFLSDDTPKRVKFDKGLRIQAPFEDVVSALLKTPPMKGRAKRKAAKRTEKKR